MFVYIYIYVFYIYIYASTSRPLKNDKERQVLISQEISSQASTPSGKRDRRGAKARVLFQRLKPGRRFAKGKGSSTGKPVFNLQRGIGEACGQAKHSAKEWARGGSCCQAEGAGCQTSTSRLKPRRRFARGKESSKGEPAFNLQREIGEASGQAKHSAKEWARGASCCQAESAACWESECVAKTRHVARQRIFRGTAQGRGLLASRMCCGQQGECVAREEHVARQRICPRSGQAKKTRILGPRAPGPAFILTRA